MGKTGKYFETLYNLIPNSNGLNLIISCLDQRHSLCDDIPNFFVAL
ncbi:29705_t:CDS:2 [Gigaspora margarita]|uniref:29705_t:CDS:1 n=1 Tax=Gigaspora margarita TaxID=4874 RepID=A0ABN7UKF7_GIGMA|nr:29705_t:CDS:2 [Gigaspora margarita]